MEAADQRGHHMAVGGMVVIVGAIQVGRHHTDVVGAILAVQELAVFQAADFSQSISFVGFFQLAGQQAVFLHGLRCHARVNAGGAQKFQLFAAVFPCGMNHVHFQRHVVIHKVRQSVLVGNNAAHLGCGQKDIFRLFGGKKFFHGILAAQVQLFMGPGNDIGISLAFQFPHNGGTYHTAVACHIDLSVLFHHNKWPSFLFYNAFFQVFFQVAADVFLCALYSYFFHVMLHHDLDQFLKAGLGGVPTQFLACLGGVTPQVGR